MYVAFSLVVVILLGFTSDSFFRFFDQPVIITKYAEPTVELFNLKSVEDNRYCVRNGRHGECSQKAMTTQQLMAAFRDSVAEKNYEGGIQKKKPTEIFKQLKLDVERFLDKDKLNKKKAFGDSNQLYQKLYKDPLIDRINQQANLILNKRNGKDALAVELYHLGILLDSNVSYFQLAQYYFRKKDTAKVLKLMEKAALEGHKMATFDLALNYRAGHYVTKDPAKELQFMLISNKKKQKKYNRRITPLYEEILGSKVDFEKTAYWRLKKERIQ